MHSPTLALAQFAGAKAVRQQLSDGRFVNTLKVCVGKCNRRVRAHEFINYLPARAAWTAPIRRHNGEGPEFALPFRNRLEDGGSFGAVCQPERSILYVTAC